MALPIQFRRLLSPGTGQQPDDSDQFADLDSFDESGSDEQPASQPASLPTPTPAIPDLPNPRQTISQQPQLKMQMDDQGAAPMLPQLTLPTVASSGRPMAQYADMGSGVSPFPVSANEAQPSIADLIGMNQS